MRCPVVSSGERGRSIDAMKTTQNRAQTKQAATSRRNTCERTHTGTAALNKTKYELMVYLAMSKQDKNARRPRSHTSNLSSVPSTPTNIPQSVLCPLYSERVEGGFLQVEGWDAAQVAVRVPEAPRHHAVLHGHHLHLEKHFTAAKGRVPGFRPVRLVEESSTAVPLCHVLRPESAHGTPVADDVCLLTESRRVHVEQDTRESTQNGDQRNPKL